jgi:hypothetical protein
MTKKYARQIARHMAAWARYSEGLFAQQTAWRDARRSKGIGDLFPSTQAEGRGATSPLGGQSPGVWSGTPEKGER